MKLNDVASLLNTKMSLPTLKLLGTGIGRDINIFLCQVCHLIDLVYIVKNYAEIFKGNFPMQLNNVKSTKGVKSHFLLNIL